MLLNQNSYDPVQETSSIASESPLHCDSIPASLAHIFDQTLKLPAPSELLHRINESSLRPSKHGAVVYNSTTSLAAARHVITSTNTWSLGFQKSSVHPVKKINDLTGFISVTNEIVGEGAHSVVYLGNWDGKKVSILFSF